MCPCRQTEMDEAVAVLKEKHEREKNLLTEENRKLTAETDKVTASWWSLCGFQQDLVFLLEQLYSSP